MKEKEKKEKNEGHKRSRPAHTPPDQAAIVGENLPPNNPKPLTPNP